MSVWDEIDKLKLQHELEMKRTRGELDRTKSGNLKIDDYGFWNASYRGGVEDNRRVVKVRSNTAAGLRDQLAGLFDKQQTWLEQRKTAREEAKKKREEERAAKKKAREELRAQRKAAKLAKKVGGAS